MGRWGCKQYTIDFWWLTITANKQPHTPIDHLNLRRSPPWRAFRGRNSSQYPLLHPISPPLLPCPMPLQALLIWSQHDMLSLARTCRAFKEPALDILWARLEDLSPLVRCLPEASYVNSEGVRQFRCFNEQMVNEFPAGLLVQQAARTSRLGHYSGLCTSRAISP